MYTYPVLFPCVLPYNKWINNFLQNIHVIKQLLYTSSSYSTMSKSETEWPPICRLHNIRVCTTVARFFQLCSMIVSLGFLNLNFVRCPGLLQWTPVSVMICAVWMELSQCYMYEHIDKDLLVLIFQVHCCMPHARAGTPWSCHWQRQDSVPVDVRQVVATCLSTSWSQIDVDR